MQLDYSDFVFLTTTHPGRHSHLLATLGCAMACVKNAEFIIQHYGLMTVSHEDLLKNLARCTGNEVTVVMNEDWLPVAHTKRNFNHKMRPFRHWVNLDDDLLTSMEGWRIIHHMSEQSEGCTTIGVVDGYNARGYADYDDKRYLNLGQFCEHHDLSKAKVHYFNSKITLTNYPVMSQLYCLTRHAFDNDLMWAKVTERFPKKGVRGYDIYLESILKDHGYKINYTTGVEAIHIGLEELYIGGQWTDADKIAHTVVDTADMRAKL